MGNLTILITGGCGFIGSNLAVLLKRKYTNYTIVCVDNLKRRGSELNIPRLTSEGIVFIHGDVRNMEDLDLPMRPDIIIDAAAEPSVLAGADGALSYVVNTNLNGTVHLLRFAVQHKAKLIFLSTSRVYPIAYLEAIKYQTTDTRFELLPVQLLPGVTLKGISEAFLLDKARSIYGTTKLASELLLAEYEAFLGLQYVVNRCGVVAGPYQMGKVDQGVMALWVARHYWKKDVSYFGYGGEGKQVRDILHIEDLFCLIDYEIHHFEKVDGHTFNVGGGRQCSISLKELTAICAAVTGNTVKEHAVVQNRQGDIPLYLSDNTKIQQATGWKPVKNVQQIVEDVFEWIRANESLLKPILCQ
ncbi:CDP-paratose 2-epimerase [Filimonas zeae]|uniref:3-beta hydroxysteroid dehydrogenase n=1 Tax=Filimonas zeae TaxID=1737353 RepID=A0A917MWL9_9BACT|nr:NAD-dependent epimerase/dehydratase family protein [Filimonas zeae]MDR6339776.1 CDP-paratose 2-epimerase [Filimonas zeae]GGH69584.1 3-beta hydroxysteroid dehydrogenase [Filimonas zeae]